VHTLRSTSVSRLRRRARLRASSRTRQSGAGDVTGVFSRVYPLESRPVPPRRLSSFKGPNFVSGSDRRREPKDPTDDVCDEREIA
jgi:hypothetical protein